MKRFALGFALALTLSTTIAVAQQFQDLLARRLCIGSALSACSTMQSGAGTPESVVTSVVGDLFLRNDGDAQTGLYLKGSGSGNTGWAALLSLVTSTSPITGTTQIVAPNGASVAWGYRSELLPLSTGGTTTDTSGFILPANSIIESVTGYVQTTITTATDWKLGDSTVAGRFTTANSTMTVGATSVGLVHVDQTGTSGPKQTSASKVRVTTTGTPGAGAIRIVVFYRTYAASSS